MVVTLRPATSDTCVWQENARLPSICTMQAPHRPVPQPNLVPVSLRPSRSTHNNGVAGGASVDAPLPFTMKSMAMVSSLSVKNREWRIEPLTFLLYSLFAIRVPLRQRRLDPRRVERKIADALAGRIAAGIGNGS